MEAMLREQADGLTTTQKKLHEALLEEPIVALDEFVGGRRYLGIRGRVYPRVMDILEEVNKPHVREAYLSLGKGSGKSTICGVLMARWVYELLCHREPQTAFGLLPDSRLTVLNVSTSKDQAKNVIFGSFMARVRGAPWFEGKYKELTTECRFPKNIFANCGHSGSKAFLGYDTVAAVMDEASWMLDTSFRSVAADIYDMLTGSLKTRFPHTYKLVIVSSPRTPEDFLTEQVEWVRRVGHAFHLGRKLGHNANAEGAGADGSAFGGRVVV